MMPFFQPELGWSALEVVGLDQDCWRVKLEDAGSFGLWQDRCDVDLRVLIVALLCKKNEEGGSARASPWPLRCLSQFPSSEKRETANEASVYASKSAYLSPLGWPCIYSRCLTSWIMTKIYSHLMGSFPYCQH